MTNAPNRAGTHAPMKFRRSLLLFLLAPATVLAADLGRLTVLSGAGEPLRAEIAIMSIAPGEATSLRARIPAADVFWRANLEPPPNLNELRASVESREGRRYVVAVRSNATMENPFVQILVELESSSGVVVREYPILLEDRPTQIARPSPPALSRAEAASRDDGTARVSGAATSRPTAVLSPDGTYLVKRGDTLSSIALATAPIGATTEQMIVALHSANPAAFDAGNMNRLRAGAALSIPPAHVVLGIGPPEALGVLPAHRATLAAESRSGAERDARRPSSGTRKDRLQLTSPGDRQPPGPRFDSAEGDDIAAMRRALADAQERIALLEKRLGDVRACLPSGSGSQGKLRHAGADVGTGGGWAPQPEPLPSEAYRFLDAYGGWLLGIFAVGYLLWIVMPLKTALAWRARREAGRERGITIALPARPRREGSVRHRCRSRR